MLTISHLDHAETREQIPDLTLTLLISMTMLVSEIEEPK